MYGYTHIYIQNTQFHYNNEMFNNTSKVGPSQKATVIVTNYMGDPSSIPRISTRS